VNQYPHPIIAREGGPFLAGAVLSPDGTDITSVQVAGLIARRILCCVKARDVLTRGQRYGFIRFGSRVDVYQPLDASVKVSIGGKVSATTTILAMLPQKG